MVEFRFQFDFQSFFRACGRRHPHTTTRSKFKNIPLKLHYLLEAAIPSVNSFDIRLRDPHFDVRCSFSVWRLSLCLVGVPRQEKHRVRVRHPAPSSLIRIKTVFFAWLAPQQGCRLPPEISANAIVGLCVFSHPIWIHASALLTFAARRCACDWHVAYDMTSHLHLFSVLINLISTTFRGGRGVPFGWNCEADRFHWIEMIKQWVAPSTFHCDFGTMRMFIRCWRLKRQPELP